MGLISKKFFGAVSALCVAGAATCHGQGRLVGQWDIKAHKFVFTNDAAQWVSPQGVVLEFSTNEWVEAEGALRNVGGVEAEGLRPGFESATNKTVRAGVLLVKPVDAPHRVRTTLFCGHHTARLANFPGGGLDGEWDSLGPSEGVQVWVNRDEAAPLQAGVWQFVSFVAPEEMPLERVMVFADPFVEWKRGFEGDVKAVVLLSGEVSEAVLRGMQSALALRYGVAGIPSASGYERREAQATGFSAQGVWGTLFLVR